MPLPDLKVAALPIDIVPGNPCANIDLVESRLDSLGMVPDLVVVPEMFNTGYTVDPTLVKTYAETDDGYTVTRLRQVATARNIALWGTFAATDGPNCYNRGFMIGPDGSATFYDKRHLFVLGREPMLYAPGDAEAPVVNVGGWRVRMSICYDLRFPVWNRWSPDRPYDLLVVPANWPDAREYAWRSLLIARAIENQACAVGCNRLGSDLYGSYRSDISYIFNHLGEETGSRRSDGVVTAILDGSRLDHDRRRFPNLDASDRFRIILP